MDSATVESGKVDSETIDSEMVDSKDGPKEVGIALVVQLAFSGFEWTDDKMPGYREGKWWFQDTNE